MARIFSTTGFGFAFDDTTGAITAVSGPATLSLSFAEDAPVISYSQIFLPDPGFLPDVDIGGDQPLLVAINDLLYGDEIDASVGRLVWSGGTTDVLSLFISEGEQYIFRLGGDPLPVPANATEANQFLASVVQPVGLPPAGSGLGPGTSIPVAGLPGWSSVDASDATTYEVAALSFIPGAGEGDPPQGVQASTIAFVMEGDSPPDLFYLSLGLEEDAGPSGAGATIARPGFSEQPFTILVDGQPITALAEEYQVFFARIVTTGGTTHDVMNLEFMDTGRQYLVSLGGDPLPAATQVAAAAFFDSIASVNPIPAGAGAAGEAIALSGLPGVNIGDYAPPPPPEATGDPAVLTFAGHKLVYDGDDLGSVTATEFKLALHADDAVFSYQITGTDDDGMPLADIGGTDPYAVLLDGVSTRQGLDVSIVRIVADGVAYDVLIFIDRDTNTDYIFQIDGATPLPFGSLAAAEAFRAAVDGGGSVGAIPAGSPFAPGVNFQLTDSPYLAAIDSDPAFILGGDQYNARPAWGVGDGAGTEGSLTVVNGQHLTLDADDRGPFLQVGRGANALGTVTVAGPDSRLTLESGGDDDDGVSANFGRDGGIGMLRVLDGGRFEITDPNGTSGGAQGNGWEFLNVGRGAGGRGFVDVIGGSLAVTGTGASATFGRDDGDGRGFVEDGSLRVESTTDDLARLQLGRTGGFGRLDLAGDGRVLVQAGDNGDAQVQIGLQSGGPGGPGGVLMINGGPDTGLIAMGGANSPYVSIDVGRGANGITGGGLVEVFGGFFGALNRGVTYDDHLNQINLPGDGGEAEITIGRNGGAAGKGVVRVFDGGEIFVSGTDAGRLAIGAGAGSEGDLILEGASELRVFSQGGEAGVDIGAWDGGTGRMELRGGSDAEISGAGGGYLNVGRGAGNSGALLLEEGSAVLLRGDANFTAFEIGTQGGAGAATLLSGAQMRFEGVDRFLGIGRGDGDTGGDSDGSLTLNGAGTRLWAAFHTVVGEDAGTGTLRIEDGAAAILGRTDAGRDVSFIVGRGAGSDGTLDIFDARLSLQGANGGFEPYMAFGLDGGTGRATITGARSTDPFASHGLIQIGGGASPFATLDIGRGAGSQGVVTVDGAFFGTQNTGTTFATEAPFGPVDLPGDGGRAVIRIGVQGGAGSLNAGPDSEIFAQGGAGGAAFVVGETGGSGSFALAGGAVRVEGAENLAFLGIGSGGTGEMTLSNGATGRIALLSGETGFQEAGIGVGYEGGAGGGYGQGTLILQGMTTTLEVASAARATLHVGGVEGGAGDGLLRIEDGAALTYESVEHQELNVGRAGGNGTVEVLDGGTFAARTTGAGFDTFLLVGTEGGSGEVRVDNAALSLVSEGGNAGIRVGTRFTHTADNTGTGSLILENGAGAVIEGAGSTNFWVGGLENGNGSAIIRAGADLAMVGTDNVAIIGGVFGQTNAAGGTGSLEVTGAGSALTGADTLLVGFNNGTGTLTVSDSALVEVEGGAASAFLGIGVHAGATGNGGTGSASIDGAGSMLSVRGTDAEALVGSQDSTGTLAILDGGQVQIEAGVGGAEGETGALLEIGRDGGSGTVSLADSGSALSVTGTGGAGGAIRVATEGAGSFGLLHIAAGAAVTTGSITIGAADTKGVVVLEGGGALTADTITVNAEGVLGGTGTITGDVTITGGSIGAGDTWQVGGGPTDGGYGIGTLTVQGDLTQTGGEAYFDFGGVAGDDLLDVTGALSFSGTEFTLVYNGVTPTAGYAVQLAQAAGGITLDAVTLAETSFDGVAEAAPALELRAGGTELWFVTGTDLPPPTGQAITMSELGREGTTITYGISIDPALVAGGVLDNLAFLMEFDESLITYVPGSISAGFTAEAGSLLVLGTDLGITDLGTPVLTFEMDLTAIAGARDISFDLTGVTVNGLAMEDQTGTDAPSFDYDAAFFTLSGLVDIRAATPGAISPGGTGVRFTETGGTVHEATLGADGAFDFLLEAGTAGTLEMVREYDPAPGGPDTALGIQDVLGLFRVVVNSTPTPPQADDFIAADFNRDGAVTIQDVLGLFRHIVGSPTAPDPGYVFINQADDLSGVGADSVPLPAAGFDIAAIGADTDLSFLGILSGDLQGHL